MNLSVAASRGAVIQKAIRERNRVIFVEDLTGVMNRS